ncbi:type II CAAX prenyl endopeptidase Rce1 family protein [Flavobacterium sp. ASV13]|uniref:CPBP family glutamic-type intramembrane protease n=1 Tax=Flavobacterium sp. ASV13 TaxID=1506583 RepID=UPI0005502A90|nr:CPBP family glutamic-type intramembrane protease [Flavobacterium sp. ASV13]
MNYRSTINYSLKEKVLKVITSYLLGLSLIIITVLVIILPLDFVITKYLHFESVKELIHQTQNKYVKYPFYITVFVGPIIEELLFRLCLIVNRKNISIFTGFFLHEILRRRFIKLNFHDELYFYIILIGVFTFLLTWKFLTPTIINSIDKRQNWLVWISIIFFGLIHITNIKILHWELALFYPFYVIPQMIMGYFITNLRLKYGFFWGLSLHSLFNFVAIII